MTKKWNNDSLLRAEHTQWGYIKVEADVQIREYNGPLNLTFIHRPVFENTLVRLRAEGLTVVEYFISSHGARMGASVRSSSR